MQIKNYPDTKDSRKVKKALCEFIDYSREDSGVNSALQHADHAVFLQKPRPAEPLQFSMLVWGHLPVLGGAGSVSVRQSLL